MTTRHLVVAYGTKRMISILFYISALIPIWIVVSAAVPALQWKDTAEVTRDETRFTGTYANPNVAGAAACIAAVVAFAWMLPSLRRMWPGIFVLNACVGGILFTFSRASLLMVLIISLAQFIISPGSRRFIALLAATFIVCGAVFTVFKITTGGGGVTLDKVQQNRMDQLVRIFKGELNDETTGGRGHLAMEGIREWMQSPLVGNGLGSQRTLGDLQLGPHNTYVRVLGEAGLIPEALLLATLASLAYHGFRCQTPMARALVLGYTLLLTMRLATSHSVLTDREHNLMLGVCFGMLAACAELRAAGVDATLGIGRRANGASPSAGQRPAVAGIPGQPASVKPAVAPLPVRPAIRPT